MKNKIISILLAVVLCAEFTLSAFAAGEKIGVSSAKFAEAEVVGTASQEDGSFLEYLTCEDGLISIIIAAQPVTRESDFQVDRKTDLLKFFRKVFEDVELQMENHSNVVSGYPASIFGFTCKSENDSQVKGKTLAVHTDNYVMFFIIYTDISDYQFLGEEADEIFNTWIESIEVMEIPEDKIAANVDIDKSLNLSGTSEFSNVLIVNRLFEEERFVVPYGGHGWAAERANNLADQLRGIIFGSKAVIVGDDNAANGADRVVTDLKGVTLQTIQSKYYNTARNSINACFDDNGIFRYMEGDTPMTIEVPSDQYDDALQIMQQKIRDGKVPGITDPKKASDIVKKGSITYKQAQHIAKAGTIESLTYDAIQSSVVFASAFGISAIVEYATSRWNGDSNKIAIQKSIYKGIEIGGASFITSVLASQLSKAGLNSLLVPSSEAIVNALGPKAAAVFVNSFRVGGTQIFGAAAMKSAAKLLRGNAIVSTISLVVFTVPDIVDAFRGRISGKQLLKNVAETAGGIAGGVGGWAGGAALGSLIAPGVGTVIGGIIGSLAGGVGASVGVGAVADLIAEDDADEMLDIISEEFGLLATEYLLNQKEADTVAAYLNENINADKLKEMYASSSHTQFARDMMEPYIVEITSGRQRVALPSEEEYNSELILILEDMSSEEEAEPATEVLTDKVGNYYLDEKNEKQYINFFDYDVCMKYMGNANTCSRVTVDGI